MNGLISYIISLIAAFALTAAIEGAIVFALFRKPRFVYYSVLWNLLTNPALNLSLLLAAFFGAAYAPSVLIGEACVLFAEALLIRMLLELPAKKALLLSLLLNTASFLTGLVLNHYFF